MQSPKTTYLLIMAGGKGTRLWPESTSKKPKQFLALGSDNTLLEETLIRFEKVVSKEQRYIVTTADQKSLVHEYAGSGFNNENVIIEPEGRDTAPCILLSIASLQKAGAKDGDVIAVMPADHVIQDKKGFQDTITNAVNLCSQTNSITTIGVPPQSPHTGYGYIKVGAKINDSGFSVQEFKEKPNLEMAQKYLNDGNYFWNAGMFMAPLGVFKEEFAKHAPELYQYFDELVSAIGTEQLEAVYSKLNKISVDFALMEKSENVTLVPATFDWNDLGSWEAIQDITSKNAENYIVKANGHFFEDSHNNIIFAPNKYVALQGVKDKIVVVNDNAVLIIDKDKSQDVKKIVTQLKEEKREELI